MQKTLPLHLQEIIYATSDSFTSRKISELEEKGKIRKIASKVYSANLEEEPSVIIRRNLFSIIGHLLPFIEMLSKAQRFSATIFGEDFDDMQLKLENSNAFAEHTEAKLKIFEEL